MRLPEAVLGTLLVLATPAAGFAAAGTLILAHNGTQEWNAQVRDIAARMDAQQPTEIAFGIPTRSTIAPAVDRLARRRVNEVVVVPFFLSVPVAQEHLTGYVIPLRMASAVGDDPVLTDIILARARQISRNPAEEVLVLVGYGSNDEGTAWGVNLAPCARRLNAARRFASIVLISRPDAPSEREQQQVQSVLDRQLGLGRRILVVPMLSRETGGTIEEWLRGMSYEVAKGSVLSDDQLVDWMVGQARSTAR